MKRLVAALTAIGILGLAWVFWPQAKPQVKLGSTGTSSIRQEVNIVDKKYTNAVSSYATSSEIVAITDNNYSAPNYYFEAVASTSAASNSTIKLVNATSSATVATLTANSNGTFTRYRSSKFLPNASTTVEYKIVVGNEAVATDVIAARIVVLQDTSSLTATETQIEIGSATTSATNTTTLPLQSPKYWYYNSAGWDASPTFYVEASYKNNAVASSTFYNVSATTTATFYRYVGSTGVGYVVGEAWGGGGGGDGATSAATLGGGGGGGGTYARATTTVAVGSANVIGVGRGGAEGTAKAVTASSTLTTASGLKLAAEGGEGATTASGAATSTLASSVGGVITAGGSGGNGQTDTDTGGGGGGSAGPDGYGISGAAAASNGPGGNGGAGDKASGGAGGAGGNGGDDTCDAELGKPGVNNVLGAGGGGGADGDVTSTCSGGGGGRPGGGGGGSDEGALGIGGPGQVKITEWIGTTGIALQEDDGAFGSWTYKQMVLVAGLTSTTSERVRSSSFTPTNGKHYRLVASTTSATASYDIYNAKIVVSQTGSGANSWVATEDFDSYSVGSNLTGAGGSGWSAAWARYNGTGTITNETAPAWFTTIAARHNALLNAQYRRSLTTARTSGTVRFKMSLSITSPSDFAGVVLQDTSTGKMYVKFGTTDIQAFNNDTASYETILASYSVDTAYTIDIDFDNVAHPNQYRVSVNGGAYSGYKTVNGGTYTSITQFAIDASLLNNPHVFWVDEIGSTPENLLTKLEPQYLLANTAFAGGTSLQNFLTSFDTSDWLTTNNYLHAVSAIDNSTSTIEIDNTTGPTQISGSSIASPDNYATSTGMCLSSNATLDTKATNNQGNIYSSSIIVQVGVTSTAVCAAPVPSFRANVQGQVILQTKTIIP